MSEPDYTTVVVRCACRQWVILIPTLPLRRCGLCGSNEFTSVPPEEHIDGCRCHLHYTPAEGRAE